MKNGNWISKIHLHGEKIFSQGNQDGIIKYICENIKIKNKYCIEFGFDANELTDGCGANTTNLIINKKWVYILLDGCHENHSISLYKEFITSENICDIFKKHNVPTEPGYISVDIDSTDLWVTEAILCKYRPSFFSIEFNPNIPIDFAIAFPNDPNEFWQGDKVFGSSLKAINIMGSKHNYSIVYAGNITTDKHHDAFFIRNDLLDLLTSPSIKDFKHVFSPIHPHCITGRSKIMLDYEAWIKTKDKKISQNKALKISKLYLDANLAQYLRHHLEKKVRNIKWLCKILKWLKIKLLTK